MPRRQLRCVVGVLLVALVGLAAAVSLSWAPLLRLDQDVAAPLFDLTAGHRWLTSSALTVQAAFSTAPMTAYAAAAALALLIGRRRSEASLVVVTMVLSSLLTALLKLAVGRARPQWPHPITQLASPSFPSGHSSGIASAATLTVLLALLLARGSFARRAVLVVSVGFAVVVGVDRLLLGVHYLSDVLAGYTLGVATALAVFAALGSGTARSDARDVLGAGG